MRGPLFVCRARRICRGPQRPRLSPAEAVLRGSQFAETRPAPSAAVHGSIGTRSSEDSIASITAAHRYSPNRVADRPERADRNAENSKDEVADWRKRAARQTTETEAGDYPACGHKKTDHIIWSGSLYRMLQARGLRAVACGARLRLARLLGAAKNAANRKQRAPAYSRTKNPITKHDRVRLY